MKGSRSSIPLMLLGAVAAAVVLWKWKTPRLPDAPSPPAEAGIQSQARETTIASELSELAEPPDWSQLDRWQHTISRNDFLRLMEEVYTVSNDWRDWFVVGENDVLIKTGVANRPYHLRFADTPRSPDRQWKSARDLGAAPPDLPLEGLHVAIDPGHIGGRWATMEERWFRIGDGIPVMEGNLTLQVARLLRPMLETLGAEVSLVREETEPVTDFRPESFTGEATVSLMESPTQLAERLFYRTAEIRARAKKVNEEIQPDLVLCLHFNAEAWGDPENPTLVPGNHLHLLVNGAYTSSELGLADQRFELVRHLLDGSHGEASAISRSIISAFNQQTDLPPYFYETNSSRAVNIGGNPYLWGRNLLANRIYLPPVIFLEPYVMNSQEDYARIQEGDYEGLREVAGKSRPSIFREYARAVTDGLANYYRSARRDAAR